MNTTSEQMAAQIRVEKAQSAWFQPRNTMLRDEEGNLYYGNEDTALFAEYEAAWKAFQDVVGYVNGLPLVSP